MNVTYRFLEKCVVFCSNSNVSIGCYIQSILRTVPIDYYPREVNYEQRKLLSLLLLIDTEIEK